MGKGSDVVVEAFMRGEKASLDATMSTGTALYLHGSKLVEGPVNGAYIMTLAGFDSNKTRDRINSFFYHHAEFHAAGLRVHRKNGSSVLSGTFTVVKFHKEGDILNADGSIIISQHDLLKIQATTNGVKVEVSQ